MNITYYLGAGASFNALPIVGELEGAFAMIGERCNDYRFNEDKKEAQAKFVELMNEAYNETIIYGTIDTYAKKLSLAEDSRLSKLKTALSLFFSVWQGIKNINDYLPEDFNEGRYFKRIDPRYFGLLSNYLENQQGTVKLPSNVKFISWNYDVQLEMAVKKITDEKRLSKVIDRFSYPKINSKSSEISIVHLNGIAGLYQTDDASTSMLHDRIDSIENLEDLFDELLFIMTSKSAYHDNHLTYAWEEDPISKGAINHAENIMRNTDILVIIGYSFPTFNDKVDKKLLQIFKENGKMGKIYFQDPSAEKEILTKRFGMKEENIQLRTKTSQFILPLEFMNKHEGESPIEIITATYGTPDRKIDILDKVKELVSRGYIQGPVDPSTFSMADPAFGRLKEFYVAFRISNIVHEKRYKDGETFLLLPGNAM
jgi:hypothetical protein